MKKNVLVFGLIAGLFVATWTLTATAYCYSTGRFEGSMWLGYASMLLAFSLVYVGIKNYRDKYNQGTISFIKAFQIGLYISLVASTIYVLAWLIDYYLFVPDFMERYCAVSIERIKASGADAVSAKAQINDILEMKELYKSPLWVVLFTYLEILPVGLVVTIIAALILKRKQNNDSLVAA